MARWGRCASAWRPASIWGGAVGALPKGAPQRAGCVPRPAARDASRGRGEPGREAFVNDVAHLVVRPANGRVRGFSTARDAGSAAEFGSIHHHVHDRVRPLILSLRGRGWRDRSGTRGAIRERCRTKGQHLGGFVIPTIRAVDRALADEAADPRKSRHQRRLVWIIEHQ